MTANRQLPYQQVLGYLGLLPFIAGFVLTLNNWAWPPFTGPWVFVSYSACIASFICGIWWGGAINRPQHTTLIAILLLSNGLCLTAWLALVLSTPVISIAILLVVYTLVLALERQLKPHRPDLLPYFAMRRRVTAGVVLLHVGMLVALSH